MTVERYIRIFAGIFILASLALGIEGSPMFVSAWFWHSQPLLAPICFSLVLPMSVPWVGCCENWACLTQRLVAPPHKRFTCTMLS